MNVKGNKTETAPMKWADFLFIREAMLRELPAISNPVKAEQFAKFATGVVMGVYFGLRFSDLSRITWADLIGGPKIHLKEIKTGKTREIVVNETVRKYADECLLFCPTVEPGEAVISGRLGYPLTNAYFNRRLKWVMDRYRVGYTNASSHVLRKTFGRRVYENGGESLSALLLLMRIFNHSSTAMTSKYLGINQSLINEAYINLDG